MKINKDGVGAQYTGNAEFCMVVGINCLTQGDIEVNLEGCNSYVLTSLDYLLDQTEQVLSMAKELRHKRDNS